MTLRTQCTSFAITSSASSTQKHYRTSSRKVYKTFFRHSKLNTEQFQFLMVTVTEYKQVRVWPDKCLVSICAATATASNRRQNASQALRIFTSPQTTSTLTNTHNNINKCRTRGILYLSLVGREESLGRLGKFWWRVDAIRATTDVSSRLARTYDWRRRPASTRSRGAQPPTHIHLLALILCLSREFA